MERSCKRCGKKWNSLVAYPKRCRWCSSQYWDTDYQKNKPANASEPLPDEVSDAVIEFQCSLYYGPAFIEKMKAASSAWNRWSWAQREAVLKAEKDRMEGVEE